MVAFRNQHAIITWLNERKELTVTEGPTDPNYLKSFTFKNRHGIPGNRSDENPVRHNLIRFHTSSKLFASPPSCQRTVPG